MRKFISIIALLAIGFASSAIAEDVKKPAAAEDAKKPVTKKETKPPSVCAGLDQTACGGNTACSWHKEGKTKKGTAIKAHCQKKPAPVAKKKTTTPPT